MRDSGIGAYRALALVAYALLATAALARLSPPDAGSALVCGHALGRWAALAQLTFVAPAREDGLGATFSATMLALALALGSAVAVAITLVAAGFLAGLCAVAGAAIAAAAIALLARRAVGGRTGDTLGAAVLVTELVVYSVLAAYLVT